MDRREPGTGAARECREIQANLDGQVEAIKAPLKREWGPACCDTPGPRTGPYPA